MSRIPIDIPRILKASKLEDDNVTAVLLGVALGMRHIDIAKVLGVPNCRVTVCKKVYIGYSFGHLDSYIPPERKVVDKRRNYTDTRPLVTRIFVPVEPQYIVVKKYARKTLKP